jgi:hypothetical protein
MRLSLVSAVVISAVVVCAAVGIAGTVSLRASGEPEAAPDPTVTVVDKTRDVLSGSQKPYPTRSNVDIHRVQVTRLPRGLKIVIETLAPSRNGGQDFAFVYGNTSGSRGGRVQVIQSSDYASSFADANVKPSQDVPELPPGSFRFSGNRLIIVVPNTYLDPLPRFRWQVVTFQQLGDTDVLGDYAPDRTGRLDVWTDMVKTMAQYP